MTIPFQFDEALHAYKVDGMVVPGVTRVLDHAGFTSYENVRADILERRSRLGTIVHSCCHYVDEGDLDWTTVAEEAKGYIDSWSNLVSELSLSWSFIEYQCISEIDGMKFGMKLDRVGMIFGRESVVEIKITRNSERHHGIQTAAYALGLPHPTFSTPIARFLGRDRYIAKLDERGRKAQLIPHKSRSDFDGFRAGLVVSHLKLLWGREILKLELEEVA